MHGTALRLRDTPHLSTMAELRTAEETVQSLRAAYRELRDRSGVDSWAVLKEEGDQVEESGKTRHENDRTAKVAATAILRELDSIRDKTRTDEMQIKMQKFRKRLNEIDPVTGKTRYGEKTQERVTKLLQAYGELDETLQQIYGETGIHRDDNAKDDEDSSPTGTLEKLKRQAEKEEQERLQAERLKQEAENEAAAAAERERIAREEAEKQAAEAAEAERRRQRAEVEEAARRTMEEQRHAAAHAARLDQQWQASIPKGAEGVRQQLQTLLTATAEDKVAQRGAIDALYTIFSQIVSRPEEVNFRRIRRNHPKFEADIGQYPGGKEILIAAGFRLGAIDDVPSYISTEPDIEKDMDGWGAWFDLLKETLAIVEEAMIKL
eukprot:scaffold296_cov102-Amphora_coffeaeformis.AAC.22